MIKCHPDVVDVGVVGVPNPPDDLPKAFVVKKEGAALTEDDIVSFVKGMVIKMKDGTASKKLIFHKRTRFFYQQFKFVTVEISFNFY